MNKNVLDFQGEIFHFYTDKQVTGQNSAQQRVENATAQKL